MTPHGWVTLVACTGQAMLATIAFRARDPLAQPLLLLSADLFVWNFAELAYEASGDVRWHLLDITTSPFTPTLGLHFVLLFVGRRRRLGAVLAAAYAFSGALSILAATGFFRASPAAAMEGTAWMVSFVAGVVAAVILAAWLLVAHYRGAASPEERARTRLLLLALPLAAVFGTTDLLHSLVPAVPELSSAGALACALLMGVVALRRGLFGRDLSASAALYAAFVAVSTVLGYLVIFRVFPTSTAMLLWGSAPLTFAAAAVARESMTASAARRARTAELALLGRFSAQMAHDLKNPLAALKGAVDFLKEERSRGNALDGHADFLDLIGEEAARLQRTIDDYHRLGRVEPALARLDLGALVRDVLALSAFSAKGIDLRVRAEGALDCVADRDLIARALENLVRNALEAMPSGGTVTVSVERGEGALVVRVEDTGAGMDARVAERAFDDFYTTKATGSGLGLAFVRRVVEAHGGSVSLGSRVGRGTIVELRLPSP